MANQEHLDILAQGRKTWNSWRKENQAISPDLRAANLYGAKLSNAKLYRTDLAGADIRKANLYRASLYDANLVEADLSGAKLSRATLYGAYLTEANLVEADFSGANLSNVQLTGANLSKANLSGAKLSGASLYKANLSGANLSGAQLYEVSLHRADLSEADLFRANLSWASLSEADLSRAYLSEASLHKVDLSEADLSEADLTDADLTRSTMVKTNLTGTTLTGCEIYGISAWNLNLEGAKQHNLNVSDSGEPAILVDNLEVAQFIYLLLNNERVRQVIDTITSKVVLILGRFTPERKAVLDAIRNSLRQRDYLPVLFDFEKPGSRDITETVSTLAHMARFIIADLTDAKSIPQELQAIVPNLPSVPVQPILLASDYEYGMFESIRRYPWVLEMYRYYDVDEVLTSLEAKIISPAEAKARELSS
jgi:uncharacterized protein YjbI with pentapeptide repeats